MGGLEKISKINVNPQNSIKNLRAPHFPLLGAVRPGAMDTAYRLCIKSRLHFFTLTCSQDLHNRPFLFLCMPTALKAILQQTQESSL